MGSVSHTSRWSVMAFLLLFFALGGHSQILHISEMNTEDIRALNKDKTVFLMPGGVLEEHGPYLPSFTDGYINQYFTKQIAKAISARDGWTVVVFPQLPLGVGGANEIGQKFNFPGTYAVRPETLRAVMMDLGDELGQQGFKWIFIINAHGGAHHNIALNQASEYFRDTYDGIMVNLINFQVERDDQAIMSRHLDQEEIVANGIMEVHAGLMEHSFIWHLHPELVSTEVADAIPQTISSLELFLQTAQGENWPGYFGNPKAASPELGKDLAETESVKFADLVLEILDGRDPDTIPKSVDQMVQIPPVQFIMQEAEKKYQEQRDRQAQWIRENTGN